jgi:hypothetical protein
MGSNKDGTEWGLPYRLSPTAAGSIFTVELRTIYLFFSHMECWTKEGLIVQTGKLN